LRAVGGEDVVEGELAEAHSRRDGDHAAAQRVDFVHVGDELRCGPGVGRVGKWRWERERERENLRETSAGRAER
jgi:hypothetical protein